MTFLIGDERGSILAGPRSKGREGIRIYRKFEPEIREPVAPLRRKFTGSITGSITVKNRWLLYAENEMALYR